MPDARAADGVLLDDPRFRVRAARAETVIPFHFSPRYEGREAELVAELEASRSATEGDRAWN